MSHAVKCRIALLLSVLQCWSLGRHNLIWTDETRSAGMLWIYKNVCIGIFCNISVKIIFELWCSIRTFSHFILCDLKTPASFLLNLSLLWSDEDLITEQIFLLFYLCSNLIYVSFTFLCAEFPGLKRA